MATGQKTGNRFGRAVIFPGLICLAATAFARDLPLAKVRLAPGFHISLYAPDVPDAREMSVAPDGTVFVGTRQLGNVYALSPDHRHPGVAARVIVLARGLRSPNGVAFHDGALYVAEINRIWRFDGILSHLKAPEAPRLVSKDFPSDRWHGWKFIAFGPGGWLYVPVGAPCNICVPDPDRYAAIFRMKPDGTGKEIFARGIRNTVGFDWDPRTKQLWFTDNGRDNLGDNTPPDELNFAPRPGMNFGYPYCHGTNIPDPRYGGPAHPCSEFTPPALDLPAHVASLGMMFYTGKMFPAEYHDAIFIAEHGSWDRTHKIGYRVVVVKVAENGRILWHRVFAHGWRQGDTDWGRPVDVATLPDGSLLVSDDTAGCIYRITYDGGMPE